MKSTIAAIAGLALGLAIAACAVQSPRSSLEQYDRRNEIALLENQIRGWRQEAHMDVAPSPRQVVAMQDKTVAQAAGACPDSHVPPKECTDICDLADAICDNAEDICKIADDLRDSWSRGKCDSAKASCRQAKEHCCQCNGNKHAATAVWEMP